MIQITFTPETPEQAAVVADAISKYLGAVGPVKDEAPVAEVPKPKTRKSESKSTGSPLPLDLAASVTASAPSSAEVPNETVAASSEPEAPAASTVSLPVAVTLEEVRAVLAQLSQAGKAADVKNLITTFGAAKLTEIPADKYSDVLAAAQEL